MLEGRKRNAVMCLSTHSPLGMGVEIAKTRKKVLKPMLKFKRQEMNYKGHTFATHFVHAVMPKEAYFKDPENFHSVLNFLAADATHGVEEGLTHLGEHYWFACIGLKGDAPFLVKAGRLQRSFYNLPKKPLSQTQQRKSKAPNGICHLCMAGSSHDLPFEDCSDGACHNTTLGDVKPWDRMPGVLVCPHDPLLPEGYFFFDPWHLFHLGEGRNLVSCGMQLILPLAEGTNVDSKLQCLFEDYSQWCQRSRRQKYLIQFRKDFFHLEEGDFPRGTWTKGNLTTSLLKWLRNFTWRRREDIVEGSLLADFVLCHLYMYIFPFCQLIVMANIVLQFLSHTYIYIYIALIN